MANRDELYVQESRLREPALEDEPVLTADRPLMCEMPIDCGELTETQFC